MANHTTRAEPPMSARQGALIIKHLESLNRSTARATKQAKADADRIVKCLQRVCTLLERRGG